MKWRELLDSASSRRTLLCVGLDTDLTRLGPEERIRPDPQYRINREIIDATKNHAAAFKLNMAFYESEGVEGLDALKRTIDHIRSSDPEVLVILDAKKGDIGNTSKAYARAAFENLQVDSITLNGYMGRDAIDPFSTESDKLCFVLCRTSNPSSSEVQDSGGDEKLFLRMAALIKSWNERGNLGLVVGATFPDELKIIRNVVGFEMPILVPGIGAQQGDLRKVLENGTDPSHGNILINVSRGIMFAYKESRYEGLEPGEAARKAATGYSDSIKEIMEDIGRW